MSSVARSPDEICSWTVLISLLDKTTNFDIVCLLYRMIYYILVVHFHAKQCQCGESDICTNFCDLIVKSFILLLYFF